jgi:hypothetical protein
MSTEGGRWKDGDGDGGREAALESVSGVGTAMAITAVARFSRSFSGCVKGVMVLGSIACSLRRWRLKLLVDLLVH